MALFALPCLAQESVPDMLERVLPGVVTVGVRKSDALAEVRGFAASEAAYARTLDLAGVESQGSGFVIERNGKKYVITVAHVVQTASGSGSVVVYSINQSKYETSIVAMDSQYDLAALSFDEPPGPEVGVLQMHSGKLRVGESVYAIGNPISRYPYTVTAGIIGGLNRTLPDMTGKFGYVQSSATVTWGNSGGPLIAANGEVVGINSRIEIKKMDTQNFVLPAINFALEGSFAVKLIDQMLANGGRLQRAYLGIKLVQDYDAGDSLPRQPRPVLTTLLPGSPSEQALTGKEGCEVTKIGRREVRNIEEALEALEQIRPGQDLTMELRDAKTSKTTVVSLKAGALTDENTAAIANLVTGKQLAASLMEVPDGVRLRTGLLHPPSLSVKIVDVKFRGVRTGLSPPSRIPPVLKVEAVGTDSSDDVLFRVRNFRDLGLAIKIAAMTGTIDFLYSPREDQDRKLMKLPLCDDDNILRRTLFY